MGVLILTQDSGELGNRLVTYSYLLAFGAAHNVSVRNLCFWRYAHLFAEYDRAPEGRGARALRGLVQKPLLAGARRRLEFDGELLCAPRTLGARMVNALASRFGPRLAPAMRLRVRKESAWDHECVFLASREKIDAPIFDPANVTAIADRLRTRFALRADLQAEVRRHMRPLRHQYDLLVGVHRRQGDYATYRGGQWHFPEETYRLLMQRCRELFAPARVGFLLASSAAYSPEPWAGLPVHAGPGRAVLDLYSLTQCDFLAGPPSTFSGWASFMGARPIHFLEHANDLPTREQLQTVWTPRYY